jgi:type I restriction enzyme, S subunit
MPKPNHTIPQGWKEVKLGHPSLGTFSKGSGISKNEVIEEGIPCVRYGEIYTRHHYYIKEFFSFINHETALQSTEISKEDILFAGSGETKKEIGKAVAVYVDTKAYAGGDIIIFKPDTTLVHSVFLSFSINSGTRRRQLSGLGQGDSVVHIYKHHLDKLKLLLPPFPEQKAIAQVLTDLDEGIDLITAKIDLLKKRKKSLMQQLLTGKTRLKGFSGEWKEVPLNKIAQPIERSVKKPTSPYYSLGIRSHCKGTLTRFVEEPSKVMMDVLYTPKLDDLIVNITFAWEGAITVVTKEDEGKLVSHRFPMYRFKENALPSFYKYWITQKRFLFELANISPGGAGRNRVLSKKDFLKLRVNCPNIDEQRAIAKILTDADEEIDLYEKKLKQVKQQKKYLLNKLVTGEIRLPEFRT